MRLFLAILPDEPVERALLGSITALKEQGVRANYTRPENLHLTLAFLGETERVEGAMAAMRQAALSSRPFEFELDKMGRFGDLLWVGLKQNEELLRLVKDLQDALLAQGFQIERGKFKAHITVARRAETQGPIRGMILPAGMTVQRLSLMKSERKNGLLCYTEIGSAALK